MIELSHSPGRVKTSDTFLESDSLGNINMSLASMNIRGDVRSINYFLYFLNYYLTVGVVTNILIRKYYWNSFKYMKSTCISLRNINLTFSFIHKQKLRLKQLYEIPNEILLNSNILYTRKNMTYSAEKESMRHLIHLWQNEF